MISNYKYILRTIYEKVCKLCINVDKLENEIVYLASFPNNMEWFEEIIVDNPFNITIAYNNRTKREVLKLKDKYNISILPISYNRQFFKQTLSKIANSKVVIADNYYPFLSALPKRDKQHIVQVWHASGAIKKFGLEDPKIMSQKERSCHLKVYDSYTDYVVASDNMEKIFINSYHATNNQIHKIGYPRSDLYNHKNLNHLKKQFFDLNPNISKDKPLWLYAPTYRMDDKQLTFDFSKIAKDLDIQIIEKYHPHTTKESTTYKGSMQQLLSAIDGLITDYSSLPFDYANLHKEGRIIYFQYDLEQYEKLYGIQPTFKTCNAGMVVKDLDELVTQLSELEEKNFEEFNQIWNQYNFGDATQKFQNLILTWLEED